MGAGKNSPIEGPWNPPFEAGSRVKSRWGSAIAFRAFSGGSDLGLPEGKVIQHYTLFAFMHTLHLCE